MMPDLKAWLDENCSVELPAVVEHSPVVKVEVSDEINMLGTITFQSIMSRLNTHYTDSKPNR